MQTAIKLKAKKLVAWKNWRLGKYFALSYHPVVKMFHMKRRRSLDVKFYFLLKTRHSLVL